MSTPWKNNKIKNVNLLPWAEVTILDEFGDPVGKQTPFQVDWDSVYEVDIDTDNSDFSNWVWDSMQLFKNPFSTSIINSTTDNPKQIVVAFRRTIKAQQIWLWENNGWDFSNIKISLLWSGWATRSIYDESADSTKRVSLNAEFENELFNSLLIEFYTTDTVSLSNITIQKARYNSTQMQWIDPDDELVTFWATKRKNFPVSLEEYQWDAFGRLRVSEPFTIFDSSLTTPVADDLFWSTLTNWTWSWVYTRLTSSFDMTTVATGDYVVRQTKQRFKYQPGKSHEVLITWLLSTEVGQIKKVWLLDYDNVWLWTVTNAPQNWVCFTNTEWTLSFCIYNNGVLTESVDQVNRNIDKMDWNWDSKFLLDPNWTNIFFMDMERLWVGAVRCWFVSATGEIVVAHQFRHASSWFTNVYMRTANLPVSYSITSTSWWWTMKQVCSSVISEWWFNPTWIIKTLYNETTTNISNARETIIWVRQQEDNFEYAINIDSISVLATTVTNWRWFICFNPTYTGTPTRTDVANSVIQESYSNFTITDLNYVIANWQFSWSISQASSEIKNALRIWKDLAWTRDEIWLVIDSLSNNENFLASMEINEFI